MFQTIAVLRNTTDSSNIDVLMMSHTGEIRGSVTILTSTATHHTAVRLHRIAVKYARTTLISIKLVTIGCQGSWTRMIP